MSINPEMIGPVLEGASYVVSGASVLAALIPSPKAEKAAKVLTWARKALDFLACNWKNAKNSGK